MLKEIKRTELENIDRAAVFESKYSNLFKIINFKGEYFEVDAIGEFIGFFCDSDGIKFSLIADAYEQVSHETLIDSDEVFEWTVMLDKLEDLESIIAPLGIKKSDLTWKQVPSLFKNFE